jgi:DNA repair exonuclease SbcCD ATPase subunit
MISFKNIQISNFGCLKEISLSLDNQGLLLFLGENHDTTAADSNGSGKTTIFRALSWVLFGRTIDGIKSDQIIRSGKKECVVKLLLEINNNQYFVTRTKNRGKTEKLSILQKNRDKKRFKGLGIRSLKDAQLKIQEILGLDWVTFRNTVLYGQNDVNHFAHPRTTNSDRVNILSQLLQLDKISEARKIASKLKSEASTKLSELSGQINVLEEQIADYEPDRLKNRCVKWDENQETKIKIAEEDYRAALNTRNDIDSKQKKYDEYQDKVVEIKKILNEYKYSEQDYDYFGKQLNKMSFHQLSNNVKLREEEKRFDQYHTDSEELLKGICPLCGSEKYDNNADKANELLEKARYSEDLMQVLVAENSRITIATHIANDKMSKIFDQLEDKKFWIDKLNSLNNKLLKLSFYISSIEKYDADVVRTKKVFEDISIEENPYEQQILERDEKYAEFTDRLEKARNEYNSVHKRLEGLKFWSYAFSPIGISSYLIDTVLPIIEQKTNKYLEILADGDIVVSIDNRKAMKNGTVKNKIVIETAIENRLNVQPSGGQMKKITLACDLALMELLANRKGSAIDLLLLDEVLDGLDSAGRSRVMDLLEIIKHKRSTIAVISHDPEIIEKFNKGYIVGKKDGIAELRIL